MILFEFIRLLILTMPLGIFITFGLFVVVTLILQHAKLEKVFKRILFFYCFSASIASFFLFTYYYYPPIFASYDVFYCAVCIFTIVLFHHMLCFMTRIDNLFDKKHYILATLVCILLSVAKHLYPSIWVKENALVVMVIIMVFGILHSLLSLLRLHHHQLQLLLQNNNVDVIDKSRAVPFLVEILLFPWVFAVCPLITGQNPGIFTSLILMASITLALRMNIPLTYSMIRHYAIPYNETSLLDSTTTRHQLNEQAVAKDKPRTIIEIKPRKTKENKLMLKERKKELKRISKEELDLYFLTQKPYLNSRLTIADVVAFLGTNRTTLSNFINKEYKMNFNAYVNHWRLRDTKCILSSSKYKDKTNNDIFKKAGFIDRRAYLRAKKNEDERKLNKKTTNNGNFEHF